MELEGATVVARPISEVFSYWADLERAGEWSGPVIERSKLGDAPVGVGTRYHAIDRLPGRRVEFTLEITAYEPAERMAAMCTKPVRGSWEATFEEVADGTRLHVLAVFEPSGLMRLLTPPLAVWARRRIEKDLAKFKSRLEGGAL